MLLKTLLNKVERFKSFVYKKVYLEEIDGEEAVVVEIRPRKNTRPICRVCMKPCGTHTTERPRRFEFVPFWKWKVYFEYAPRRADCAMDGALVEWMP